MEPAGTGNVSVFIQSFERATPASLEGLKMLPTHRQSYGRSRRRRAHDALTPADSTICPLSGMPKLHHRVSAQSGYVRPGLVIRVKKLGIGVSKD